MSLGEILGPPFDREEMEAYLSTLPDEFRGKVAQDLLAHLKDGRWDEARFNPLNDYQRHLYALFLRLTGLGYEAIWAKVYVLSTDVTVRKRQAYVDDVLHSTIVGFPTQMGELLPVLGVAS